MFSFVKLVFIVFVLFSCSLFFDGTNVKWKAKMLNWFFFQYHCTRRQILIIFYYLNAANIFIVVFK